MTDKEQIIIDGVDVSQCMHYRKCVLPDNIGCKIDDFLCCDKPNCYFKQLARKTQECEELKEQLRRTRHIALNQTNNVNFYEKDNDRYRKALEEIEEYIYNNTDFDINDSIQSKTAGYDILQIIKDV